MSARTVSHVTDELFELAAMLRAAFTHLGRALDEQRRERLAEPGDLAAAHDAELVLAQGARMADRLAFELAESDLCAASLTSSPPEAAP